MTNVSIQATPDTDTDYLFAQPLNGDFMGFSFSTMEQYVERSERLRARGCDEVELSYLDGPSAELWAAADVSMANIGLWFDTLDTLDEYQHQALFFLTSYHGYSLEDALPLIDDVMTYSGSPEDYAEELIDDMGALEAVPETLRFYIDYKALSRDMLLGGDIHELYFNGTAYVMSGV